MDEIMFKIAGVLSDRTRYTIYDYIFHHCAGVSVQDIADEFGIHPNVARLHLTKLEDVSLIRSNFDKKSKKGGRPNKVYTLSNETISFHFPHRDLSVITTLAIKALHSLGNHAHEAFIEQNYQYGKELGQKNRLKYQINHESSLQDILDSLKNTLESSGLNPSIQILSDNEIEFEVRNCTYKDSIDMCPDLLCKAHQKVLQGIFESFFDQLQFTPLKTLQNFTCCNYCHYKAQFVSK